MEISNLILHEQLPLECIYLAKNKHLKKKIIKIYDLFLWFFVEYCSHYYLEPALDFCTCVEAKK